MDCRTALQLLPTANGAIPASERHALERHLAGCAGCRAEQAVDVKLGQAIRAVLIPTGLKERLLAKLAAERRLTYRRWFTVTCTAAAATLALVAFSYWYWQVEPERFAHGPAEEDAIYNESGGPAESPARVREHFRSLGQPISLPADLVDNWDFKLLVSMNLVAYDGKPTPTLTFQKGTAVATVRILPPGQLAPALRAALRDHTDPRRRILGNPARDPFIALVEFHEGAKLEDFLHPTQRVA